MILTDEDVKALKLEVYGPHKCAVEVDTLRTVLVKMTEAAVLEKLKQQKVAKYEFQDKDGTWHGFINESHYENTVEDGSWPIRALYAAPVPAAVPDDVVKQRDELLVALEMNGGVYAWCDDMEVLRRIEAVIASVKGSA